MNLLLASSCPQPPLFRGALLSRGLPIGWTCASDGSVKDKLEAIFPWLKVPQEERVSHDNKLIITSKSM